MFQFPNGSIKSLKLKPQHQDSAMFQFPNGSIKSTALELCPVLLLCFNSLMVRLKA